MPKTVDTRRYCKNLPQPKKTKKCRDWVAEDCCMLSHLLAVPSCVYSFWHGVIPAFYFVFNDFSTCFTNFLCRLSRTHIRIYAHVYCAHELQRKLCVINDKMVTV